MSRLERLAKQDKRRDDSSSSRSRSPIDHSSERSRNRSNEERNSHYNNDRRYPDDKRDG